jgi:hypothetical protein
MPAVIPPGTILVIYHENKSKTTTKQEQRHGLTVKKNRQPCKEEEETIWYCTRSKRVAVRWVKKAHRQQRSQAATRLQARYRGIRDRHAMATVELLYFPHEIVTPGGYLHGLTTCRTIQRYWRGAVARMRVLEILTHRSVALVQGPARMLHAARKRQALSAAVQQVMLMTCHQPKGNHHHHHRHHAHQRRLTVYAAFRMAKAQDEASRTIQQAWRTMALNEHRQHHCRRSSLCFDFSSAQYYNSKRQKYYAWLGRSQNQFHLLLTALILTTNRRIFQIFEKSNQARQENLKSNRVAYFFRDDNDDDCDSDNSSTDNETSVDSDLSNILACLYA